MANETRYGIPAACAAVVIASLSGPAAAAGLHLGWCNGVGNPHNSSSCGNASNPPSGDSPPFVPPPGSIPTANQLPATTVLPQTSQQPPSQPPGPGTPSQPLPSKKMGQGGAKLVSRPTPQPPQSPGPSALSQPLPSKKMGQGGAKLVSRPTPQPPQPPPAITHQPTYQKSASSMNMIANKAGRHPAHAIPRFQDGDGNTWDCAASGFGKRRHSDAPDTSYGGVLPHILTADAMTQDLPARHVSHPDCVIKIKRRHGR